MSNIAKLREFSLADNFGNISVTIHCLLKNLVRFKITLEVCS